jgi:hypothetical protein
MTITLAPARNEYTGNAGQTIFNYTFKIFENTDLNVYVTPAGQECSDGDLTTAYTVSGVGDQAGGSITLNTPTSDGDLVTIVSSIPSERTTDYQNNGDFRPDTVNEDFDRVVSIVKKIEDKVNRSPALPECYQGDKPLGMDPPKNGNALIWDGAKEKYVNFVPTPTVPEIPSDKIIGNFTGYTFSSVDDLKLGKTSGGQIVELKDLIDSGDVAASTLGYYGTYSDSETPSGGANYILTTLVRARAEKGGSWVPDTYGDHYLFGGTDYVAILVLKNHELESTMMGIIPTAGDKTSSLRAFFNYVMFNKVQGLLHGGDYEFSDYLFISSDNCECSIKGINGTPNLNYTGDPLGLAIQATSCDIVDLENIKISCNNLISTPIDIRRQGAFGGYADATNVEVYNCKQTGSITINPVGIFFSGTYLTASIIKCTVDGVSYENSDRNSTGVAIANFSGIAKISGSKINNITTPTDIDADGIKVFGTDVSTPTSFLGAIAEIDNNIITNCSGRMIKLQVSEAEIHGNQFKLETGFTTITEWRCIDAQANNSHIHDNTVLIGNITFGSANTLFTLQNNRDDGNTKSCHVHHNRASLAVSSINFIASCSATNGHSSFVIENNHILGAPVKRGVQFAAPSGSAGIDSASIIFRKNIVQDYATQDMFQPFTKEDFGDKLYLELVDNVVLNKSSLSRIHGTLGAFELDQFKVSNNTNNNNSVGWPFDMDDLPGGCAFSVGNQAIANKSASVGDFFWVVTDGFSQKNISSTATNEYRRTKISGTWYSWVYSITTEL